MKGVTAKVASIESSVVGIESHMGLYAIIRKKYDVTGRVTDVEVFDSDNDLDVLVGRAKSKLTEESKLEEFRGFSLPTEGFEGKFKSQDTLMVIYKSGLYRSYNIVNVGKAKRIRFSYEDQFADMVGGKLIDYSVRCDEISEVNVATYYLKNKFTKTIHDMSSMEEMKRGKVYKTSCGLEGSHFGVIYQDSSNEVDCKTCIKIREIKQ